MGGYDFKIFLGWQKQTTEIVKYTYNNDLEKDVYKPVL